MWVTSGGRCALWHTGQRQVQHTLQSLRQHQACASSACQAEFAVPKQALQTSRCPCSDPADLALGDVLSDKVPTA